AQAGGAREQPDSGGALEGSGKGELTAPVAVDAPSGGRRRSCGGEKIPTPPGFEGFFFFYPRPPIQLAHVAVGHLLDLVMRPAIVVFGDGLVLQQLLDGLVAVPADVAHRHAMILGYSMKLLDQLLAALFGQRRNRDADDLAVVGGI